MDCRIVKKIHQVWIQGAEHFKTNRPEFYKWSQEWNKIYPDYEYHLWSEAELLPIYKQFSNELYESYLENPSMSSKSDFARMTLLHFFGGIYADTDYEPFKRADFLFENMALVVVAMNFCKSKQILANFHYNGAFIYAQPGTRYTEHLLKQFASDPFKTSGKSKQEYMWEYGPVALKKLDEVYDFAQCDDVRVVPHNLTDVADFSQLDLATKSKNDILKIAPFAIGVHRCAGESIGKNDAIQEIGMFYSMLTSGSDFAMIVLASLCVVSILVIMVLAIKIYQLKSHAKKALVN